MDRVTKLLKDYKSYKNKVDSFHYQLNTRFRTAEEVSDGFKLMRAICEEELPQLTCAANSLKDSEINHLYSKKQKMCIDDYNIRVDIFGLLSDPSTEVKDYFYLFKKTVIVE
ncbi:hypothetical protein KCM76_24385 [Zooshikella marina]|uniref:hypothetical protein n=1 Tax=Zooshikella ganghwensis TaxID=202772 RepID=UPI001BAF66BC|nr:hypothetical protein [Zooshikella ganghwensis]MBU2709156.1 hypothetical protein [Zooshikella ganghwensis]